MIAAHDPAVSRRLKGLEKRFSILASYSAEGTGTFRVQLRPDRDSGEFDRTRRLLVVGVRPFLGADRLADLSYLAVSEALGHALWQDFPFDPEAQGCPRPLFELLETSRIHVSGTAGRASSDPFRTEYFSLRGIRSFPKRRTLSGWLSIFDPYVLGKRVLFRRSGAQVLLPHESSPILTRTTFRVTGYRGIARYRNFVEGWDRAFGEAEAALSWDGVARVGERFFEEWKDLFERKGSGGGFQGRGEQAAGTSSVSRDRAPVPQAWREGKGSGEKPQARQGRGNPLDGAEEGTRQDDAGGLGLETDLSDLERGAEIPYYEPGPSAGEVFPWDLELIRREVEGLIRFLKIGLNEDTVDGLAGRLVAQKLASPTFRVLRKPLDPRRPRHLKVLVVADCSLSMTGDPHYYSAHLVRVLKDARIARTMDVVACSTRYLFRLDPADMNRLVPDETDGFYTLMPFIEQISGQYDMSLVLSDCQNSLRSVEALKALRKRMPTIGCYVLPTEDSPVQNLTLAKILEDGRTIFPKAFLYASSFQGLGRRVALYLNAMRLQG